MDKPLVSIGMPTFNGERFIKKSLSCLLSQSYANIELIISDNNSTDRTAVICQQYVKKDKRVKYYRQKQSLIPPKNFNFVLNKSSGDYFMWAADDDFWDEHYIEKIMNEYQILSDQNIALITPRYHIIDFQGKERLDRKYAFQNRVSSYITFLDFLKQEFYSYKGTLLFGIFRSSLLKKIDGIVEDASFATIDIYTLHKIFASESVYLIDEVLFYKREDVYKDRITSMGLETSLKNLLILIKTIVTNLFPTNFLWFFRRTRHYYQFNDNLLDAYKPKNKLIFRYYNFISSIQFLIIFFPTKISVLKKRELIYSR